MTTHFLPTQPWLNTVDGLADFLLVGAQSGEVDLGDEISIDRFLRNLGCTEVEISTMAELATDVARARRQRGDLVQGVRSFAAALLAAVGIFVAAPPARAAEALLCQPAGYSGWHVVAAALGGAGAVLALAMGAAAILMSGSCARAEDRDRDASLDLHLPTFPGHDVWGM